MRDSDLIRKLLKAGRTFRQIAQIAKCSHGSVWAEKSALIKEDAERTLLATTEAPTTAVVFSEVPTATAA